MRLIAGLLLGLVLTGCASQGQRPAKISVAPATEETVKACEYLDDVVGTSGWYGVFASRGIENARSEAMSKAAEIGATHIVWQSNNTNYGSTSVSAKAYRCKSS